MKKQKDETEALVVALEAVVVGPNNSKVEVPLFCLATERIIVRVRLW